MPQANVVGQLRSKARSCEALGSPIYGEVLGRAADDAEAGEPVWRVLRQHAADSRDSALALRFASAVHRLVLEGRAPGLARHYPSAGGSPGSGLWQAFRDTVAEHPDRLATLLDLPVQTNEVGRCAALLPGFLLVAQATGLPLRVRELGASAGLNLRFDHYRYEAGERAWGPVESPVRLAVPLDGRARAGLLVDLGGRRPGDWQRAASVVAHGAPGGARCGASHDLARRPRARRRPRRLPRLASPGPHTLSVKILTVSGSLQARSSNTA